MDIENMENEDKENQQTNPVEVQKMLGGIQYPADKQEIIDYAREKGAHENVLKALDEVPEREYESPADLNDELGDVL